jgi:predicted RNA-binding Zn-ribbon protein involved in translation (DUF1610 family)
MIVTSGLQCDDKNSLKQWLSQHIKSIHEGVTYDCDKCDFSSKMLRTFNQHIKSIHERGKYNCEKCNFNTAYTNRLVQHMTKIHGGVTYECDKCEYKSTVLLFLYHTESTFCTFDQKCHCKLVDKICHLFSG